MVLRTWIGTDDLEVGIESSFPLFIKFKGSSNRKIYFKLNTTKFASTPFFVSLDGSLL